MNSTETLKRLGSNLRIGLTDREAKARLAQGANEVPERKDHAWLKFAGKFWGISAWMIELIALLSLILHKYTDLAVAIGLLLVNAIVSFMQEQRASTAVEALRHRLQVKARALRDGVWVSLPACEIVPGDILRMRMGDFVPADMQIIEGDLLVDQSALTGESQELERTTDALVYSGSIVRQGEATGIVVATGLKTYFGRTTELVQTARPKLHMEEVVSRVVKWLLLIVGSQVAIAAFVSFAQDLPLFEILPLGLVLMMSAIPVALPVMFTVSMAVGSMELSRLGVMVTRLSAAEDAANMDILCADKTGTLTMNRLSLTGTLPQAGFSEDDVLDLGAMASNEADQDAIDLAFLRAAREQGLPRGSVKRLSFLPFSPVTRHTEATVEIDGKIVRVMKGSLRSVAENAGLQGTEIAALETKANTEAKKGVRILAIACADDGEPWRFVGIALLRDSLRPDSKRLIGELRSLGVKVIMLTGDALPVAQAVAEELGLGNVARATEMRAGTTESHYTEAFWPTDVNGLAEVFPEDKFHIVQGLQAAGHIVGMTGDGVNDAPALRQAEVGIAVSGSTDVAKGAASVVLTDEGLAGIVDLLKNGRAIYQRLLTWIMNKVSRTILKSGFVVVAFLVTGKFVISALGMVLLIFMTDFVKIALSTDRVRPSPKPESWNIGPLVKVTVILGLLMLAESLSLLYIGWHRFQLGQADGQLKMFSFLTLLFFALFSIVSIRERRAFWASRPSWPLAAAFLADAGAGMLIGTLGLVEMHPIAPGQLAFIIAYTCFASLVVNDVAKRMLLARTWVPEEPSQNQRPD